MAKLQFFNWGEMWWIYLLIGLLIFVLLVEVLIPC